MDTKRRQFLLGCSAGFLGALSAPGRVWADRMRVLGEPADLEGPLSGGQISRDLGRWLGSIRVGQSASHGPLFILWLAAKESGPPLDVITLDEARKSGALLITERAQASVRELVVENRGKLPVLLLAGEILVGGRQNRVLREDLLLPPLSGARSIGVYCVEQGRWNDGRKEFESKGSFAQPGLRSRLMEQAGQNQVWEAVARTAREAAPATPSPTQSYQAIYEDGKVQAHIGEVERTASLRPPAAAHGAAVFVGPSMAGLDLFHSPGLFTREWPKLLRAHALEAYGKVPSPDVSEVERRARVQDLLTQASRAEGSLRGNAGVGQLFEFRAGLRQGVALLFESRAIHTAIL
jgi:ARG/rhodanese/phosphatase superfamily protein